MKRAFLLWCNFIIISLLSSAQSPITFYTFNNNTNVPDVSASGRGWNNSGSSYLQSNIYTMHFGRNASSSNGLEREISSFNVGTKSFSRPNGGLGTPFTKITINRHPNMTGDTINTFYEFTASSGNNLYLTSNYIPDLETIINSNIVNRGSDNLFSNSPSTRANIERVDLIYGSGINVVNAQSQGFLLNERGGNDNFKIAAITSINGSQIVTGLGNLLSVSASSWGQSGPQIETRVMSRRIGSDPNLRPKQDVPAQPISGIYVSLADLGISNGTTIYGFVIFPNDVNSSMDLLGLTNVPRNTNQGTDGGLDLMAGMGYFAENWILNNYDWKFSIESRNGETKLFWNPQMSPEIKTFEIERSYNGFGFEKIGQIERANFTNQLLSYSDYFFINNKVFYRLKAINYNGSVVYSEVLSAESKKLIKATKAYPNPFSHTISIELQVDNAESIQISCVNKEGKVIYSENKKLNKGIHRLPIENSRYWSSGQYFLRIQYSDGNKHSMQILKQ